MIAISIFTQEGEQIYQTFTVRIEEELSEKLKYIADYEGRTKNRQVERLIKNLVADFEKEHGPIDVKAYYQGR